jgi:hypothetical protein
MEDDPEAPAERRGEKMTEKTPLVAKGSPPLSPRLALTIDAFTDSTTVIAYDPMALAGLKTLWTYKGTVFAQKAMWAITLLQLVILIGIALALYFLVEHPEEYKTETLTNVVKAVSVLIGFLLGMFLSSCLNRWWDTIKSLETLFGVSKKLVMSLNNFNCAKPEKDLLARRVVLSIRMLELEIKNLSAEEWADAFATFRGKGYIEKEEQDVLASVPADQRSFFTWSLISAVLRKVQPVLDGFGYDRVSTLVLDGLSAVSSLKTLMGFQFPFLYMHMLAFMVHLCNLLIAIGTGVNVGLLLSLHKHGGVIQWGGLFNELVFFVLQTFFYQAALFIGASLSFPFSFGSTGAQMYQIPLEVMVQKLDTQLQTLNNLAERVHGSPLAP